MPTIFIYCIVNCVSDVTCHWSIVLHIIVILQMDRVALSILGIQDTV